MRQLRTRSGQHPSPSSIIHLCRCVCACVCVCVYLANIAGGFLSGVGTNVRLMDVHISDSHLLPHPRTGIINRGGGAISVSSGKLYIEESSFTRCSALSLDGTLEGCEATYKPASALCSQGTGGAVVSARNWGGELCDCLLLLLLLLILPFRCFSSSAPVR